MGGTSRKEVLLEELQTLRPSPDGGAGARELGHGARQSERERERRIEREIEIEMSGASWEEVLQNRLHTDPVNYETPSGFGGVLIR